MVRRPNLLCRLAFTLAVCVGSQGCAGSAHSAAPPRAKAPTPSTAPATARTQTTASSTTGVALPVNPVGWSPCGAGLQCGLVAVPLDYSQPRGRLINIAVERHPATDLAHRIGSLVLNPGGPGDSGIDDLPAELRILTPDLQARFDIVSFDPRGVERSAPIHCSSAPASAELGPVPDPVPQTQAARQALLAANQSYADACARYSGDLLPFVGTTDTARDLDRIRAALGDDRLTFLGHSYGTLLGATYADLFPTRVRAMVLDGAIDPALSIDDMSLAQAVGFDASLQDFFTWCSGSTSCPWRPAGDPRSAFLDLVSSLRSRAETVGARTVGPGELFLGVLGTLYAQSFWPSLGRALAAVATGNGSQMLVLSDDYQRHGSTNAVDANTAITCLDHPVSRDISTYPGAAAAAGERAPVFGPVFAWGALSCAVWPAPPTRVPHAVHAPGSPPILVVGTTGDPATPYAWAVQLASELDHGVLVGRRGVDHVAYYYSGCVRAIDASYLIDGTVPPTGTMCAS